MRISTSVLQFQSVSAMLDQQAKLARTQQQLTTGLRILTPSDDPAGAVQVLDLTKAIEETRQFQENIAVARERLSLEESTLSGVNHLLQRIREVAVQGLNDTNSPQDRLAMAAEVRQLNEDLLALANTKSAHGEYLFAGYRVKTPPFAELPITVTTGAESVDTRQYSYSGDLHQRLIRIGPAKMIADGDEGRNVFGTPFDHGTPPTNLPTVPVNGSVFDVVNKLAEDLVADRPDSAILDDLDGVMERILNVQTTIGARLSALDQQENLNDDKLVVLQTNRSEIQDLDYAEAISRLNTEAVALEAAQKSYAKVQGLSLFDYL